MHSFNLKIIKTTLVILVALVVINMIGGISILKNNDYYFRTEYLKMRWSYLKTEMAFDRYSSEGFWGIIFGKDDFSTPKISGKKAASVPILLYHGVIEDADWQADEVNVRLEDFRAQMFALKKAGWQTVRVEDYLAFTRGEKDLPEKSFLLTFDDGRSDSYYPVDPILKTLDYSAVMYVITNRMFSRIGEQGKFHLSVVELEKMIESGRWQIESHGRDDHDPIAIGANGEKGHFLSNKMWLEAEKRLETEEEYIGRIYADLDNSKKDIEKKLGVKVLSFAYPFGDLGQTVINFPESRGEVIDEARKVYDLSFCQTASGDFVSNYSERSFLAKRIVTNSFLSADELLHILEKTEDKPVLYEDDFSQNLGWISGWGTFKIENGAMTVGNSPTEESGLAFLNGSYLWKDYAVTSKVRLVKNGKISLAARYHDGNNYMSCDFSNGSVSLTEKINRELTSETVVPMETDLSGGREAQIGVQVSRDEIQCYLDGQTVVSGTVDENLAKGGISFKIWNPAERESAVVVNHLKVTPVL